MAGASFVLGLFSLILLGEEHGGMVAVVDNIDLLVDGFVSRDDVLAVVFRLLGCVGNALHLSHRFEQ